VQVRYIIGPDGCVDPFDRGLAYGDGLFETMALRGGRVLRLASHLDRLRDGSQRLAIPLPDTPELLAQIDAAAAEIEHGHLKLILTRGTGPRGYAPPASPVPTVILSAGADAGEPSAEITARTLETELGENPKLAGIKHLCRLEQVLGRLELSHLDAEEGLMLSTSGAVIGGTSRNLFAVIEGCLVTPDLSRAGIAGVMRRSVLETAQRLGFPAEERRLAPAELASADELFMTNALVGIQSLRELDGRVLAGRTVAGRLRAALEGGTDA
jgi:4-amino-4-deoxychorismate lyase